MILNILKKTLSSVSIYHKSIMRTILAAGYKFCPLEAIYSWGKGSLSACIYSNSRKHGVGNGNSFQYSHLENSIDRGTWWATVHGVSQRVRHNWATNIVCVRTCVCVCACTCVCDSSQASFRKTGVLLWTSRAYFIA